MERTKCDVLNGAKAVNTASLLSRSPELSDSGHQPQRKNVFEKIDLDLSGLDILPKLRCLKKRGCRNCQKTQQAIGKSSTVLVP